MQRNQFQDLGDIVFFFGEFNNIFIYIPGESEVWKHVEFIYKMCMEGIKFCMSKKPCHCYIVSPYIVYENDQDFLDILNVKKYYSEKCIESSQWIQISSL